MAQKKYKRDTLNLERQTSILTQAAIFFSDNLDMEQVVEIWNRSESCQMVGKIPDFAMPYTVEEEIWLNIKKTQIDEIIRLMLDNLVFSGRSFLSINLPK